MDHYTNDEGACFKILVPKTCITAEHVLCVVGGHDVVCDVIHACQTCVYLNIILTKQWDSIYISTSSSLDHYTTDGVALFKILFPKTMVTVEHVLGAVGGHAAVC